MASCGNGINGEYIIYDTDYHSGSNIASAVAAQLNGRRIHIKSKEEYIIIKGMRRDKDIILSNKEHVEYNNSFRYSLREKRNGIEYFYVLHTEFHDSDKMVLSVKVNPRRNPNTRIYEPFEINNPINHENKNVYFAQVGGIEADPTVDCYLGRTN